MQNLVNYLVFWVSGVLYVLKVYCVAMNVTRFLGRFVLLIASAKEFWIENSDRGFLRAGRTGPFYKGVKANSDK